MKDTKKIVLNSLKIALVLLLALLIVFSFYVSIDLFEHECTGDDCPICNFIFVCRSVLRVFFFGAPLCLFLAFLALTKTIFLPERRFFTSFSPVYLGVKLNN